MCSVLWFMYSYISSVQSWFINTLYICWGGNSAKKLKMGQKWRIMVWFTRGSRRSQGCSGQGGGMRNWRAFAHGRNWEVSILARKRKGVHQFWRASNCGRRQSNFQQACMYQKLPVMVQGQLSPRALLFSGALQEKWADSWSCNGKGQKNKALQLMGLMVAARLVHQKKQWKMPTRQWPKFTKSCVNVSSWALNGKGFFLTCKIWTLELKDTFSWLLRFYVWDEGPQCQGRSGWEDTIILLPGPEKWGLSLGPKDIVAAVSKTNSSEFRLCGCGNWYRQRDGPQCPCEQLQSLWDLLYYCLVNSLLRKSQTKFHWTGPPWRFFSSRNIHRFALHQLSLLASTPCQLWIFTSCKEGVFQFSSMWNAAFDQSDPQASASSRIFISCEELWNVGSSLRYFKQPWLQSRCGWVEMVFQ